VSFSSKKTEAKKQSQAKPKASDLLRSVSYEKGFHFFTEHGKYTGITACSTVEFAEKLEIVPIESVMFHFQRQDFQKWLRNTIGDEKLAKRIDHIEAWSSNENLRKELFTTVHNRITELQ
jgi:alpha-amylase